MEWSDDAIVLGIRPFGEHSAILEALTRNHGRHLGLVRAAPSKSAKGMLEPGNVLSVQWRARIDQQLGSFSIELASARAAKFFDDGLKLSGLSAACAICSFTMPEREVHTRVFEAFDGLLQMMALESSPDWVRSYVRFELVLLEDLGFGLDFSKCAVTGAVDGLRFVSPKTGRAVTKAGAGDYESRLLPLPGFLLSNDCAAELTDLSDGLALTEFFLGRVVLEPQGGVVPPSRHRFAQKFAQNK